MEHTKDCAASATAWSYRRIFAVSAPALLSLFADQMGFAFMFPTLPEYLESNHVKAYDTWVGAILCSQFFGNTIGSVAMGYLCDIKTSKLALQVSMIFDAVFFALSALPFVHPVVLLVVRFFVGFSSPMSTSLTFMFDRLPPECIPKAVTLFMTFGISAYVVGNLLIGTLHSTLRWEGECFVSSAGAILALLVLHFRSTPSNRVGPQPTPEGVRRVLVAPELVSGALAQVMMGYAYSTKYMLAVLRWEATFGVATDIIGYMILPVPAILLVCNMVGPLLVEKFGINSNVSAGLMLLVVFFVIIALVLDNFWAFTILTSADWTPFVLSLNPNQNKPPAIAAKYTVNGLGFVTGVFQFGYALGQGLAPVVSVLLYQITPWLPWATLAAFAAVSLAVHKALGLQWFGDPLPEGKTGGNAEAVIEADVGLELSATTGHDA